jgi:hypothetical protein
VIDYFDNDAERTQHRFRYPLVVRCLFLVPLILAGAAFALLHFERLPGADVALRAQLYLNKQPKILIAGAVGFTLFTFWTLWVSVRAWMTYIVVTSGSIKLQVVAHGRERVSWEHTTEIEYKPRLLGHTVLLHGSDGSTVHFRSSISGYETLMAMVLRYAPSHVRDQLEAILSGEEEEEEDIEEEQADEEKEKAATPAEGETQSEESGDAAPAATPSEPVPAAREDSHETTDEGIEG